MICTCVQFRKKENYSIKLPLTSKTRLSATMEVPSCMDQVILDQHLHSDVLQ